MKPRIVFLGTGQGPFVVGRQIRSSGGIVVQSYEQQIHIDPGPSSLLMCKINGINPRATTCILVSHSHLRHSNDLNAQIDAMTLSGLDRKGVLISNDSVINGDEPSPPVLSDFHKSCLEKFMVVTKGQRAGVGDVEIRATRTKHSVEGLGFKIKCPKFTVSYLGDTDYTQDIAKEHEGSDILILNNVLPFGEESDNNLNSDDSVKIINHVKPVLAVLTHFSEKMHEKGALMEARMINRKTASQVIAAKDGTSIDPLSYARKKPQKSLEYY